MVNEEIVFDYEVTGSAVSSIATGSILNGDVDGWYTIICRHIGGDGNLAVQINGDTSTNYGYRATEFSSTSVTDNAATAQSKIYLSMRANTSGTTGFVVAKLYAKSGSVRLINITSASTISGTTVTYGAVNGSVWNNTVDNITSMSFSTQTSPYLGVGTRVIILRPVTNTGAEKWVEVGSSVLGVAASSVTFSGLDGDVDQVYMLNVEAKANTGLTINSRVQFNSDTTNYGFQKLQGSNTTITGQRSTETGLLYAAGYASSAGYHTSASTIIYAKSGFIRPSITNYTLDINGTTIGFIGVAGNSWNNTVNNLTQIVCDSASVNGFATGSQFKLYALRP